MDYVDIANLALSKLGNYTRISSLNDTTRPAIIMNANYEFCRDFVLEEYPWPFATKKDALAPSITEPTWGGGNYFPLPADCISVLGCDNIYTQWKVENNFILTDSTVFNILYTYRVTDPNLFTPMFINSYSSYLAFISAMPICGDKSIRDSMYEMYKIDIGLARSLAAVQNSGDSYASDRFILGRLNGTVG